MHTSASAPLLGFSRLVESCLYVARGIKDPESEAEWLPMRFAHNSDGSVSFWSPVQSETFLDADWTQPFTVAPWNPIVSQGRRLYPFSLSYVPLLGRPRHRQGPDLADTGLRRTLMLAAPSRPARKRWLSSLARKIGSAQLRPEFASGELDDFVERPERARRFMELGALQTGLEKTRFLERRLPRLPPARTHFWEAKSSLQAVRDLYDCYAADPLMACRPVEGPKSQDRDEDFMSEYLEKQAVIEHLLHKRQGRLEELMEHATCPAEPSTPPAPTVSVKEQAPKEVRILCPSFQVLAHTKNLQFDGDVLRNKRWSGGVVFARANAEDPSFEIVVQPQDCPEAHPIIIGIAPPDVDLSQANFFSSCGGIFMCLGGSASDGRLGALGAPGGPYVQGFGQRLMPELPKGHQGCRLQLNYTEAVNEEGELQGHVCFMVSDERGQLHQYTPKFRRAIAGNVGWLPCVLLCNPDTTLLVMHLK